MTAKAAGSVTITATSQADATKKATKSVTVEAQEVLDIRWPVPSAHVLTDGWGWRSKHPVTGEVRYHKGIDVGGSAYEGDSIVSMADGDVITRGNDGINSGRGYYITIQHSIPGKGIYYTSYCHLQESGRIANGAHVTAGTTIIGKMGQTGAVTGPHLHFEFWHTNDRANYNINTTNIYVSTDTRYGTNPNPQSLFMKSGSKYVYNTSFDWAYSENPLPDWYSHDEKYLKK